MRSFALACLALLSLGTVASAEKIESDRGGMIGNYITKYTDLKMRGEPLIIDGNCLSACTLALGILPRNSICATPRARFGFHAAWTPNEDGVPTTSKIGTQALWEIYPRDVRHWISSHGGLKRKMIFLQGRSVYRYVPACDGSTANAFER